jgi:hypothetical protein
MNPQPLPKSRFPARASLTVQKYKGSLPRQEVDVSTWLLSFLVILSVGILIAHVIDAMRS